MTDIFPCFSVRCGLEISQLCNHLYLVPLTERSVGSVLSDGVEGDTKGRGALVQVKKRVGPHHQHTRWEGGRELLDSHGTIFQTDK